jgi:hypothetical protein
MILAYRDAEPTVAGETKTVVAGEKKLTKRQVPPRILSTKNLA